MAWSKNGTPQTLTSSNSNLTITDLTSSEFMTYLTHIVGTGSTFIQRTQLGYGSIDTGSNYAIRWSHDGAADTTVASQVDIPFGHEGESHSAFMINYSINIATEEKLRVGFAVRSNGAGAGNAPKRTEQASKWVNTSNQADQLKIFSDSNPYYDTGSNLTALNGDTTEVAVLPKNLQSGSRFEATDTRKIYYASGFDNSGCKAYYNFEQTSGNLINQATTANGFADGLGSSVDGTVTGATQNATGKVGSYAYSFDGSNDTVQLASSLSIFNFLHDGSSWSIAFWLKDDNSSQTSRIFSTMDDRSGSERGISLVHDTTGFNLGVYTGTASQYPFASTIANVFTDTNTWHHYILTFTTGGSTATLYKDGSSFGTWTKTGASFNTSNATQNPYIASRFGNDSFMGGDIDEFVIFDRALTADEVSYLYNSGTGRIISKFWTEEV